jgi:chromosome segregation ATPase
VKDKTKDQERIRELLQLNSELAAEIRSLKARRSDAPATGQLPAARRLARLVIERDTRAAEAESTKVELSRLSAELDHVRADRDGLERQNRELAAEVARLSAGLAGLLRRARGRLLAR